MEPQQASDPVLRRVLGGWGAALTRPRVATFAALVEDASWAGVLLSLLLAGVLAGAVRVAGSVGGGQGAGEAFLAGIIANSVLFCFEAAYVLLVTRQVRDFEGQVMQVYALALFWPLLNVVLNMLIAGGVWGGIGAVLMLPAILHGLYLTYLVVQVVPGLKARRARVLVVLPMLVLIVLALLVWGLILVLENNINVIETQ